MKNNHQIHLFYGIEDCESECSTFHAFRAVDPQQSHDCEAIAADLAHQLDCQPDDDRFQCRDMYVSLPESLIRRIQQDAISAFIEGGAKHICNNHAMLAAEIHRIVQHQCRMEDIEGKLTGAETERTDEETAKIASLNHADIQKITECFEKGLSNNDGYYEAYWLSAETAIQEYLSRMD